ncbi:MAG TPA: hypothetical protein VHC20_01000 [Candidatus Paceibacterota bacterium]|nr:hypothetical protein [Candidatus Paceibacterota bacterium]
MTDKGQSGQHKSLAKEVDFNGFVLEKSIFSNVFDKDIRRVYIYKKVERLARAMHLIGPAFGHSGALRDRADQVAVALVDGAVLPPREAREALSRELLALSSLLSLARTNGLLSPMNADVIGREAHLLLEEVASYEEPRVALGDSPTLAEIAKASPRAHARVTEPRPKQSPPVRIERRASAPENKGQVSDSPTRSSRREAVLDVLKSRGPSYIKDISGVVRGVSEKTIQRELQALVAEGRVHKEGERRWTKYSIVS